MNKQKINAVEITADNLPELQAVLDKACVQVKELNETLKELRGFKLEVGVKSKLS